MAQTPDRPGRKSLNGSAAVQLAAEWLSAGRRVDMQGLSDELGVTRMTLHRKVGGRTRLIAEGMWHLASLAWDRCASEEDARRRPGDPALRSVRVIQAFNTLLVDSNGLRQLFDAEPELSLRILTDPLGSIEPRLVEVTRALIESDEEAGRLDPIIDRDTLAYAIVKLAEALLFSDLASGRPVQLVATNRVQAALLQAGRTSPGHATENHA